MMQSLLRQTLPSTTFSAIDSNKLSLDFKPLPTASKIDSWGSFSDRNIPAAASLDPKTKPYTNGGTSSQTWQARLQLVSAGIEAGSQLIQGYSQSRALKARSRAMLSQTGFNYAAYRQENRYLTEENFSKVSQILNQSKELEGAQLTAMGASGFDISAGDQRIIADTKQKTAEDVNAANRTAYCTAFEMWRSTMMEENRLRAEAAMLRLQAKYVKRSSMIAAAGTMVTGALGAMSSLSQTPVGKNVTPDGRIA